MASDGRIYDGTDSAIAQDADTHPSYLPANVDAITVNRIMRGGIRRTRPPFAEIELVPATGQSEDVVASLRAGNWQGGSAYRATRYGASDGFVCSVAGVIYFIAIVNNVGYVSKLIEGNDPALAHTWFVQAEEWVYIQNGRQNPIAWNGDFSGKPTNLRAQGSGAPQGIGISTTDRERTSGTATITTDGNHGFSTGQYVQVIGLGGTGYNGIHEILSTPASNTFTYESAGINAGSTGDTGGDVYPYTSTVDLSWTINSPSATGTEIQALIDGAWTTLASISSPESTATVAVPDPTVEYSFRIRTITDGGETLWSDQAVKSADDPTQSAELPESLTRLNPADSEMPIGTVMEYAYGRVWVSDRFNRIFASDIVFGDGFTNTGNTRNFTEQEYWNEGGSFTPPSNLGNITGMKIMPSININDRGQGELVVFCENGAFTINGSITRTEWLNNNIQKVSLQGRGCQSPWSIAGVNNEVWFRSNDGWSLYNNSQVDFSQSLSFRKFSKEVNKWVQSDTPILKQFASAIVFDNRIIATVSPYLEKTESGEGFHRPHRGMIVLDLDQSTMTAPDASLTYRWNGIWTGPRPIQLLSSTILSQYRAFAISRGPDGFNRLFEFKTEGTDDWTLDGPKKIKSYFITKRFDFRDSRQTSKFFRKSLVGGDAWVSELSEASQLSVSFRSDSYPCWSSIIERINVGCEFCDEGEECQLEYSEDRYAKVRFPTPPDNCQEGQDIPASEGAEFQLLVEMEGRITVDRLRLAADLRGNYEDPSGNCPDDEPNCQAIKCCPIPDFDYYVI